MNPLYIAVLTYITIVVYIIVIKPNYFYNPNGYLKDFGCQRNQCILPYYMVSLISSILIYFLIVNVN